MKKIKSIIVTFINFVNLIVMPMIIGEVLARPVVSLLFERCAFDSNSVKMTSISPMFYSIGIIGFAFRDILFRIFYAIKDTKIPLINATIAAILNIILNVTLSKYMSYARLVLVTSISAIVSISIIIYFIK